ncbi:HlyD family efflux transporter periplasmic adaptor subunit [Dysosmobacter sp. Sow4_B12]|uniref:HlyD family efflux transporter periplasmic adaptor subunit n=1 Tax=Dysosmobacter sp. Sow4_B12 TaxID=3438777 RepID=UPI003F8E25B7
MKNSSFATKCLLLAVTLGVLAYFGIQGLDYLSDPLTTTLAYNYQVEEGTDLSGYVVREERVLADDAGGLLRLQRSEGERVSAGGTVALVYADQTSLDRQQEIDELTGRIDQLQFAQEASVGSEVLLKLDAQIMRSLLAYRSELAAGRLDNAEEHETELRSLVLKRDYTNSDSEDLSGQIAELQGRLKELKAQAASSVRRVTAPVSGLYSAVVDGYETVLTPDALADMTPSQLNTVKADETVASQTGKLILGDCWYYAVTMSAEQTEALRDAGGSMTLRFAKGVEQDQTVTLYAVGPEEQGRVVVTFRGEYNLAQLTLLRRQSAQLIRRTVAGIRVPNEALRAASTKVDQEGNRTTAEGLGVYCVVGMEARFKPVEVVYSGDGFVLVRSAAASDQESLRLRPGDEIIISAKDLYDGKVVG